MSAVAPPRRRPRTERASLLEVYRDDGPLGTAIGRALGPRIPLPAIALLLVAGLPLAWRSRSRATAPRTSWWPS